MYLGTAENRSIFKESKLHNTIKNSSRGKIHKHTTLKFSYYRMVLSTNARYTNMHLKTLQNIRDMKQYAVSKKKERMSLRAYLAQDPWTKVQGTCCSKAQNWSLADSQDKLTNSPMNIGKEASKGRSFWVFFLFYLKLPILSFLFLQFSKNNYSSHSFNSFSSCKSLNY